MDLVPNNHNVKSRKLQIALLSNCTVDLIGPSLKKQLLKKGFDSEVWVGRFNQFQQYALNPDSELYQFKPDFILLYLDGESLFADFLENPFNFQADERASLVELQLSVVKGFKENIEQHLQKASCIFNTIYFSPISLYTGLEYNSNFSIHDLVRKYNSNLANITNHSSSSILDVESLVTWVGYQRWHDSRLWHLARMPFSSQAIEILAENYAVAIASKLGKQKKCVVLDLDNTLWGGVVGEDGSAGIKLGEEGIGLAFVEFQKELVNLSRKGVLISICSKNNFQDGIDVIKNHPSMRLREKYISALQINWEDKASNIRKIAQELNIGLDSIVFIDDNPVERDWVRSSLPELIVPEWPKDPSQYKAALLELASKFFYTTSITEEDFRRTALYDAQKQRVILQASSASMEDFYRSLQMKARIALATNFTRPRIAQLTQKTNQFNLTTKRYTEAEIALMMEESDYLIYSLELEDKFGPNGVVGVAICKAEKNEEWSIDTFLLSCRVMGRTVENAFLSFISKELYKRGAKWMKGFYIPTPKNAPVSQFYKSLGFTLVASDSNREEWSFFLGEKKIEFPEWIELIGGD